MIIKKSSTKPNIYHACFNNGTIWAGFEGNLDNFYNDDGAKPKVIAFTINLASGDPDTPEELMQWAMSEHLFLGNLAIFMKSLLLNPKYKVIVDNQGYDDGDHNIYILVPLNHPIIKK